VDALLTYFSITSTGLGIRRKLEITKEMDIIIRSSLQASGGESAQLTQIFYDEWYSVSCYQLGSCFFFLSARINVYQKKYVKLPPT
jgi:hypothetical protein